MSVRISVIIVNYNGLEFVKHCLQSVLKSKYPYFEVIFVDNASNDGSLELVKKFFAHNPRLKIIENSKNLGLGAGGNIGAKYAKGKYLLFLDSDTEIDVNCISEIVKVLDSDPQIGAGQCKLLRMAEKYKYQKCRNIH
jgi:GT2 family glycosyltransferase